MAKQGNIIEEWKQVVDYEGLYEVSNLGRVRSVARKIAYHDGSTHFWKGCIMKLHKHHNGYYTISLRKNSKCHEECVHRLVARAFVDGYQKHLTVNHLDENPSNNRFDNLEWCTQQENNIYGTKIERQVAKISIPIIQFTLDGHLLKVWKSQTEAARALQIEQAQIWCCLTKRLKSAGGFQWLYKHDYDKGNRPSLYHNPTAKKAVQQMTLEGSTVKIWNSTREIERELGFNHGTIGRCATGKKNSQISYGYKWAYL